jgi:hypothetical protein
MSDVGPAPDKYQRLSNRAFLTVLACGFVAWLLFSYRGEDARAFVAALSVCAVGGVAVILSHCRDRRAYWVALAGVALAHALFVALVPLPKEVAGPGIVFSPLVIADMYGIARLVIFAVKHDSG